MIVIAALRVKACAAMRALIITALVFVNGHLLLANPTENCFCIKFGFAPYFSCMSGCFFMTIKTRIIGITAFEFNGYYIKC